MARIRTIKPEFPHSESMGRVSRDSRLTFIQLWTLADDAGRLRGNSRMLASLLFPYDDDAKKLIDGWLSELEAEDCIARYAAGGTSYIQILNWLDHQKIDKPSASKLPEFDESSRIVANARESSSGDLDQGSGSKDLDQEGIRTVVVAPSRDDSPIERVFEHWRSEHRHAKAILNPKRRKLIKQALQSFDEPTLREAISGYKLSPFHMGQNDQRTVYDDIELFLRDVANIERGLNCARAPPVAARSAVELAKENLQRSMNGGVNGSVVAEQDGYGESHLGPVARMLR